MNLVVRLVYAVSLAVVLFHGNGSSLHISGIKSTSSSDEDIKENLQPIEQDLKSEDFINIKLEEKEDVENFNEFSIENLETEGETAIDSSDIKNRVVRQANGNLYPHLANAPHYGNQQYYPTPGQGIPPYNGIANAYYNNSSPYNPLANVTFNQYPTPSYPHSQNPSGSPYNPGSPYSTPGAHHSPQGQMYNQYNNSRPGQQYPYGSSTPRYPTYPQNPYPSNNNFNASRNNSYYNGYPGQSYGTHNTGYPTPLPYNAASPRPGYPYGHINSTQWQGQRNNTYGYNNYHGGNSGQHNPYLNTTPRYPQGPYTTNKNYNGGTVPAYGNYNPMYPSAPPFHGPGPRPVTQYGQNNSTHNPQWNSYPNGNYSHLNNNNYNQNNPNPPYGNNNPNYPNPPNYTNGNLRPTHGVYPSPPNSGQGINSYNPAQPYNSNNPYENLNLFNYPSKYNTTNPNSLYDPRRNPPHNFSY